MINILLEMQEHLQRPTHKEMFRSLKVDEDVTVGDMLRQHHKQVQADEISSVLDEMKSYIRKTYLKDRRIHCSESGVNAIGAITGEIDYQKDVIKATENIK